MAAVRLDEFSERARRRGHMLDWSELGYGNQHLRSARVLEALERSLWGA